jgi:hypothetical protein
MKPKTQSTSGPAPLPELDLVVDGARLVSLTFAVTLFTDVAFSTIPEAVLGCFERFLQLCPADRLKSYLTENMQEHQPITKRVLGMLRTWLKPGAPPREYVALELTDSDDPYSAPKCKFRVWGNEEESIGFGEDANLIHMAFPPEWGVDRAGEMEKLVVDLAGLVPYQSGLAGFCFECSRVRKRQGHSHAWARSMRHRGIDISTHPYDTTAVGIDAIKGVNWLTLVCDAFLDRLGGKNKVRAALSAPVEVIDIPGGLLFKAGPEPRLGDTNRRQFLPEYKQAYKVLAPLAQPGYDRPIALLAGDEAKNFKENTRAWQRRFAGD